LDFPSSPTVGQVFTSGGLTYIWNGYAWEGGGSIALPSVAVVSDTPPASPVPGALWWESDSGLLFVNYSDGTSTQWVQINSVRDEPPADGNEYVRVNGVWRIVKQTVIPAAGAAGIDVTVPSWAKMVEIDGSVFGAAGANVVVMQLSGDGTTFLASAAAYAVGGPNHVQGNSSFNTTATTGNSFMNLTGPHNEVTAPITFKSIMNVTRPTTSTFFICQSYSRIFAPTQLYSIHWLFSNAIDATLGLQLKALRFLPSLPFAAGSQLHFRWL